MHPIVLEVHVLVVRSFPLLSSIYRKAVPQLNQSPTGGHFACFQLLAITNKAAMKDFE